MPGFLTFKSFLIPLSISIYCPSPIALNITSSFLRITHDGQKFIFNLLIILLLLSNLYGNFKFSFFIASSAFFLFLSKSHSGGWIKVRSNPSPLYLLCSLLICFNDLKQFTQLYEKI